MAAHVRRERRGRRRARRARAAPAPRRPRPRAPSARRRRRAPCSWITGAMARQQRRAGDESRRCASARPDGPRPLRAERARPRGGVPVRLRRGGVGAEPDRGGAARDRDGAVRRGARHLDRGRAPTSWCRRGCLALARSEIARCRARTYRDDPERRRREGFRARGGARGHDMERTLQTGRARARAARVGAPLVLSRTRSPRAARAPLDPLGGGARLSASRACTRPTVGATRGEPQPGGGDASKVRRTGSLPSAKRRLERGAGGPVEGPGRARTRTTIACGVRASRRRFSRAARPSRR